LFCSRSADQSDLSRAWRIAEGGSQGHCSEAAEFRYERETQTPPNIYPWSAEFDRLLTANESKAARERLTLIRLFEESRPDRGRFPRRRASPIDNLLLAGQHLPPKLSRHQPLVESGRKVRQKPGRARHGVGQQQAPAPLPPQAKLILDHLGGTTMARAKGLMTGSTPARAGVEEPMAKLALVLGAGG